MNDLMQEEYDRIWSLFSQARDELHRGYYYFQEKLDYTGAYIFFIEICNIDGFHSKLDSAKQKTVSYIVVPNSYEWGFFNQGYWTEDNQAKVNKNYITGILSARSNPYLKEIRFKNGTFYGYYCYNIYSKIYSWFLALKPKAHTKALPMYECAEEYIKSRMDFFMKFEDGPD